MLKVYVTIKSWRKYFNLKNLTKTFIKWIIEIIVLWC